MLINWKLIKLSLSVSCVAKYHSYICISSSYALSWVIRDLITIPIYSSFSHCDLRPLETMVLYLVQMVITQVREVKPRVRVNN